MSIPLAYGTGFLNLELEPGARVQLLEPPRSRPDPVRLALAAPIGSPRLRERLHAGQTVCLLTSDLSRPCPSHLLLPPLLDELAAAGVRDEDVTVVFGLGTHRRQTPDEQRSLVGDLVFERVRCIDSDPLDTVLVGSTQRGTPVEVFRPVVEADVRVALGNVEPHYFAGYSGGAKALVPGCCSAETIRCNHRFMTDAHARAGVLDGNPVREDIEEAAALLGLDFILNVLLDAEHAIVAAAAGHPLQAHRWLCQVCAALSLTPLAGPADLVIVSSGGAPKDMNLYQAQKALDNAAAAVRPGGAILWVAACEEGMGSDVLHEWMQGATAAQVLERFAEGFVLGGHKAAAIAGVCTRAEVHLVSLLPPEPLAASGIVLHRSLEEGMRAALAHLGPNPSIVVMPEGASVLVDIAT